MDDETHTRSDAVSEPREGLARRVHTDLPRVRLEDMVTTQPVQDARDPRGGRDTDTEFMLRNAGIL